MISTAIKFLSTEINDFLQARLTTPDGEKSQEEKIIIGNIVNQSGSSGHLSDNIMVVSLVNIEEERIIKSHDIYKKDLNGQFEKFHPIQNLNLYILFSAYFEDYNSALKSLSEVILFFVINKSFSNKDYNQFPDALHKISVEMQNLNFDEQNQLWGSLGAKYMPSALFKIRTVGIRDIESKGTVSTIKERSIRINDGEEIIINE